MLLFFVFCNFSKQTKEAGYWRVMFVIEEMICNIVVGFATNYQCMASAAFVIKKTKTC